MTDFPVLKLDEGLLSSESNEALTGIAEELAETLVKRQKYRTETEMRFSVLDDARHPTHASKYWQAVREQGVHYEQLVVESFSYRRTLNMIARKKAQLESCGDEFDREDILIELDELQFGLTQVRLSAEDRARELVLWSRLKDQQTDADPDFDTEDVNSHQAVSYLGRLENRLATLTSGSSQSEVMNVVGPLNTLRRLTGQKPYNVEALMNEINNPNKAIEG